jgi:PREDICTED: similar to futsch CG3064-PB
MQDTNDKMNELMDAFNKKLKTRRILLMSKYTDITEAPISVQDEIYTIQTLLNILEVSESDYTTEKVKSSNEIEINVTLIEEYENNLKKFDIFKEMNSSDVSEKDESEYIKKEQEKINKIPVNQYTIRKQLIEEKYPNIENAPQSIIDEYKNLEILIKMINESNNDGIEKEEAENQTKIDVKNIKIYNSILKINKTLQIINSKHLQPPKKVIDEAIDKKIDEQLNSIPNDREELKRKIRENELRIDAITKSSKMISDIDQTININTEIKNSVNQETKEQSASSLLESLKAKIEEQLKTKTEQNITIVNPEVKIEQNINISEPQIKVENTPAPIVEEIKIEKTIEPLDEQVIDIIDNEHDETNIIEQIYQAHLKIENKPDKDGIIVAKSVPVEKKDVKVDEKETKVEEKKPQTPEKVVMAVQTLIKGQEKTLISPEYIKQNEKSEIFKKVEKDIKEEKVSVNPVKTITKKDLEAIYGQRKNEPGFYEAIDIVNEALEKDKK